MSLHDYSQPVEVQPLHTVTSTEASTAPFVVLSGTAQGGTQPGNYNLTIQYWSAQLASGSGTLQFTTQLSYTKGTSWVAGPSGASITLSTTAQAGEQVLAITPGGFTDNGEVWFQVMANIGGSPTGASAVYRADLKSR